MHQLDTYIRNSLSKLKEQGKNIHVKRLREETSILVLYINGKEHGTYTPLGIVPVLGIYLNEIKYPSNYLTIRGLPQSL